MADNLFYHLGRKVGPKLRKARWLWEALTGTEADALRLEHGVGLDLAREVRQQLPSDPDPRTRQTLDDLGRRLSACVANRRRSFRFDAFTGGAPNAFALPGGFIFVSRALLELCRWDPDEAAFVLGHEMGHVIRGHAIERIVTGSAVSVVARAAPAPGVLAGWLRTVGVKYLETAYSREQELEADRLGLRLARAAGFDPQGSVRLLARLAELTKAMEPSSLGAYFASHPTAEVRIAHIRRDLQQHAGSPRFEV
jgi:predicted Zn-dependent protease